MQIICCGWNLCIMVHMDDDNIADMEVDKIADMVVIRMGHIA